MTKPNVNLKDGSEWIDHEDCIVGDEAGLKNLIEACEKALIEGESYSSELGDYVGIKKLSSDWFQDPKDSNKTVMANQILWGILLLLACLIFIGIYTVLQWFF